MGNGVQAPPVGATPTVRCGLAVAVCALAGLKAGLLLPLAFVPAGPDVAPVLVQSGLYLLTAAMVLFGRRIGLGFAAAYLGYGIAVAVARVGLSDWAVLTVGASGILLLAVLALWTVGLDPPLPRRGRLVLACLAGSAAGTGLWMLVPAGVLA